MRNASSPLPLDTKGATPILATHRSDTIGAIAKLHERTGDEGSWRESDPGQQALHGIGDLTFKLARSLINIGKTFRIISATGCLVGLSACADPQPSAGQQGRSASGPAANADTFAVPAASDTTTLSGATLDQFRGNPEAGVTVFLQCRSCHTTEPGVTRIGPSLHHVVGRHSGSIPGFNYSSANRNSGITWSPQKLFQYLENPQRVVPGTKMSFAGITDPQSRADVIAWLSTQ